jgi:hypothetical protein
MADKEAPAKPYWHEVKVGNKMQKWNYRSEYVGRLGLDKNHPRIGISFGLISVLGFTGFVCKFFSSNITLIINYLVLDVKTQVIENRRRQMKEREQMRKTALEKGEILSGYVQE